MFNPSRDQARRFFIDAWDKYRQQHPLSAMEAIAARIIAQHPEYHTLLEKPDSSIARDFTADSVEGNPFLHLSLHLAIEEQLSIDQPEGLRDAYQRCCRYYDDEHQALHTVMECLGMVIFEAQRMHQEPDGKSYVNCILKKIGQPTESA